MNCFKISFRVYHEDTDIGGVVYNANYLKYMERARSECLLALGINQRQLIDDDIMFVVHRAELDFKKAAKFSELITVVSSIENFRPASLDFNQRVCDENETVDYCVGKICVACVTRAFKPCAIPDFIIQEFKNG